jgi:DNA-directed DNA polymerase III PolC
VKEKYGSFTPTIQQRIDFEINIIREKGYAPLFIIVKEILDYARFSDVPISSRGSAASSLIAYCLGITTPEPLALNLYFERFLNPARETPPDIDTDICSKYRAKVIQFVYDHFGRDRVAMIATVNRFQRRSALREVAKAHGLSNSEVNKLSKALGDRGWRQAGDFDVNKNDPFKTVSTAFPEDHYQTIFLEAETLIGFPRHLSIHPGGIIISPGPLYELLPTLRANKGIIITQFDLDSIERLGLIKIDLLGTRGLTVIGEVARTIKKWRPADFKSSLDVLDAIPEHDQSARDLLQSTQVIGCFAIESPGMRNTLREINANSIEDIMIALALYRPGPMTGGLKVAFVRRHRGLERISHIHPTLANLLDNTYGVILYQEQVLRIASELAGLSLADSDLLRRAMSHFDPGDQMKTLKSRFIDGSMEVSDIPEEIGEKIWELMAAFAGYGFPKAHAASYAHLAWQSIWCKAQFPAEFMAAVLAGWGGYYRQFVYINESRRLGLNPRAPHVNHSQKQFSAAYPKGKPTLYMGLDQVRSLTQRTISRILDQRPFHSLEDFLTRVDPGSKEAENLILVGAFSGLGEIPKLLSYIKAGGWRLAQPRLFDLPSQNDNPEEWELGQRVAAQKKILGIGMDAHPVELARLKTDSTTYVKNSKAKNMIQEEVLVMGIRQTIQRYHALDGSPYYILELDDSEEVLPVKLSPDFYTRHQNILSSSKPFFTAGIITREALTNMIMLEARDFKQISI